MLILWISGILYPYLFANLNNKFLEFLFAELYSTICHQDTEKCISINGAKFLVCARCTGIYCGALISALVIFSHKKIQIKEWLIFISSTIILTDVLSVLIGIYDYSKTISFITGIIFGGTVYLYFMKEIEKFLITVNNEFIK
jgi:uncharacterized membrane protein